MFVNLFFEFTCEYMFVLGSLPNNIAQNRLYCNVYDRLINLTRNLKHAGLSFNNGLLGCLLVFYIKQCKYKVVTEIISTGFLPIYIYTYITPHKQTTENCLYGAK